MGDGKEKVVELGDRVKEKITGFIGIVTGISHWLTGCSTCGVQSKGTNDGKPISPQWFDIGRLEVIDKNVISQGDVLVAEEPIPGGPQDIPQQGER
jgi:hypothetical protein